MNLLLAKAKNSGAQLAVLGEMFACPYSHKAFRQFAEPVGQVGSIPNSPDSRITTFLSSQARTHGLWLVGGSFPELSTAGGTSSLFNTAVVFNEKGELIHKYRKLHLFDVAIQAPPGSGKESVTFRESDTLSPGNLDVGLCETPWGFQLGLGICYDIRFPELAIAMRERSNDMVKLLVYPGQFNMVTGPLHWQLLGRARAVDTQAFCILASVARSADPTNYQV